MEMTRNCKTNTRIEPFFRSHLYRFSAVLFLFPNQSVRAASSCFPASKRGLESAKLYSTRACARILVSARREAARAKGRASRRSVAIAALSGGIVRRRCNWPAVIGPSVDRGPCNVNRNANLAGYYRAPVAVTPRRDLSPGCSATATIDAEAIHVQVVIKIAYTRAVSFEHLRTLPEGLHGCKLVRHLHRVQCRTVFSANYARFLREK